MGYSRFAPATGIVRTGEERATLVRRTYALLFASVVITVLGTAFGLTQPAMMDAVHQHPFIAAICWFAPLMLAQVNRKNGPRSIGLVFAGAFVLGLVLSPLIAALGADLVAQAAILTLSTFAVLTAYAWISTRDFSAWGGFFVTGLWVVVAASFLNIFFHNEGVNLWIAAVGLLVMSGLLVFDTWRIRNIYGPDDYVMAAVSIYLDLLNMFLFILQLLGGGSRSRS